MIMMNNRVINHYKQHSKTFFLWMKGLVFFVGCCCVQHKPVDGFSFPETFSTRTWTTNYQDLSVKRNVGIIGDKYHSFLFSTVQQEIELLQQKSSTQQQQQKSKISTTTTTTATDSFEKAYQQQLQQQIVVVPGGVGVGELENGNVNFETPMDYQKGLITIGFCTLVFASLSPVMHAALTMTSTTVTQPPPVLLLNAIVSIVAFISLLIIGPFLENILPPTPAATLSSSLKLSNVPKTPSFSFPTSLSSSLSESSLLYNPWIGGIELGLWKSAGTICNLFGLSLTTADHGAFLIQLTTLIVPVVQGICGVPIPQRIQASIVLALLGVGLFTQDTTNTVVEAAATASTSSSSLFMDLSSVQVGDLLCIMAAGFYATYDLRLFQWGKRIEPRPLMNSKILTQTIFSILVCISVLGIQETISYITTDLNTWCTSTMIGLLLWSGIMVNSLVPFLQVSGQQAIGPSRAQTIYASQPLWAAIISYIYLHETIGIQGFIGGGAFLGALFLAATTPPPSSPTSSSN